MDTQDKASDEKRSSSESEATSKDIYNPEVDISGIDEKKVLRKIDIALIPWFSCLYLLSFLDRTSIGNAKLYHLVQDLHITDNQYLLALTIFFISQLLVLRDALQHRPQTIPPQPLVLLPNGWLGSLHGMLLFFHDISWCSNRHRRSKELPTISGASRVSGSADLGPVQKVMFSAIRWMLGLFEAGLYPGVAYHLSCWYKRSELGIRTAVFTSATTLSGAFGGLLAAAISKMGGIGGRPAWAWIFILEGLITILAGLLSLWLVQDFPDKATFLTEAERTFVIRRLQGDDMFSAAGEKLRWRNVAAAFRDWKTWVNMVQLMGCDMPLYAFSLFTPSIVNQLGFKATKANLLTVPIYAFSAIVTCCVAVYADRRGRRGICNLIMLSIGAVGYIILIISRNAALSYFAVYVAACGIFPVVPNTVTWVANNHEGTYKRSVAIALGISMGNLNGAVSSNVYRMKDQPWYRLGHGLVLMYICIAILSNALFLYLLKKENARRDRGERDEIIGSGGEGQDNGNGRFATVEEAKMAKGDNWSGYRYIL
ncbi:MFS domain-containing protein [Mycena kentingensis (nom. inval.)]|nr:MFS domain-containing protein [Mycena kentingensis (nom. inval.)]